MGRGRCAVTEIYREVSPLHDGVATATTPEGGWLSQADVVFPLDV